MFAIHEQQQPEGMAIDQNEVVQHLSRILHSQLQVMQCHTLCL